MKKIIDIDLLVEQLNKNTNKVFSEEDIDDILSMIEEDNEEEER